MSLASEGSGSSDWMKKAAVRGGSDGMLAGLYAQQHGAAGTGAPTPPTPASAKPPSSSTSNNAPGAGGAGGQPGMFDPTADPVYQQVQAQMAAANSSAQSLALSQEEQELLNLGDPTLAKAMLGANSPMLGAISGNPESQYAQLQRQYQEQLQQFGETIDPSLVDSGYRVQQEHNMAQGLQDERASAASQAQSLIQQYQDQLAASQAGNADTQTQALSAAYNRMVQQYLTNPPAASTNPSGATTKPSGGRQGSGRRIAHKSRHGKMRG